MSKRAASNKEKSNAKLLKTKGKLKKSIKLEIDNSDDDEIEVKKEKISVKLEKRLQEESSSSSSESDIDEKPLTSPLPKKRKTPRKSKKTAVISSDSEDVFMDAPKKGTQKKTPVKKSPKVIKKATDEEEEEEDSIEKFKSSPKTPLKKKKQSKQTKKDILEISEENSSDVEQPVETPLKSLQKSEVIILSDSEDDVVKEEVEKKALLPDSSIDINNNNATPSLKNKKKKDNKTENKRKKPSLFEVLEPMGAKAVTPKSKGKEEEEEEEEEETVKVSSKKKKEKQPNKRRKKTWEDVARFARINFDTPTRSTTNQPSSMSLSSSVTFSLSSALDSMQGKKKKGRVMNKLAIPHKVLSLQHLCMEVLCNYIEYVESFGIIPSEVQNSICALLAKKRKLNTNTLNLFLDPQSTSLNLTNISEMDPISLSRISECSLLKTLSLNGCGRLTDEALSIISRGCPNLINIKLNGCYMVSDISLSEIIESHPLLENLLLGWITRFTSKFIKTLAAVCSKLNTLAFIQCPQLNDEMLSYLGALPNLENFQLEGNNLEGVTDVGICEIFTSSVELIKSVILKGVPNVTDKGLVTMLAGTKQLKLLQLDGMSQLTDNGISHIAERALLLDSLSIGRCGNLTDPAVGLIATFCGKTLSKLSIEGLHNVTKKSLMEIPQYCAFLRDLNLSWCRDVDDELCQCLLEKCKNLRKLTLWGCHQVTDVMVGLLLKKGVEVVGKDQFLVTTNE